MTKRSAVAVLGMMTMSVAGLAFAAPKQSATQKPKPQMQKVLDSLQTLGAKGPATMTPTEARSGVTAKDAVTRVLQDAQKSTDPEPVANVEDRTLTTPGGDLPVRVYTPTGPGPFPAVVYFHGGGFVLADKDVYDASPRALANQAQAVVISVDYRRAPEDRFPAAVDDATAAFKYVHDHPDEFNVDSTRVAVAGESAGANLATAVSLREKRENGPMPVFQLLVYPFVGTNLQTPSHQANGQGNYVISNRDLAWFWSNYLGDDWKQNRNPEAVPLFASKDELKGLPPALIVTGGLDPLKDDGTNYGQKLRAAGVPVTVKNYPGVTHEFFGMSAVVDEAKKAQADAAAALKKAFARKPNTKVGSL